MPEQNPIRDIEITGGMIRLGQLLKFANLIDTGSEAKDLLSEELVRVDGEIETRRGRQLTLGMVVTVGEGRHAEGVRLV